MSLDTSAPPAAGSSAEARWTSTHAGGSTLTVTATGTDPWRHFQLCGVLDATTCELVAAIVKSQRASGHRHVWLDLTGVHTIDTDALACLRVLSHEFHAHQCALTVAGVSEHALPDGEPPRS